MCTIINIFGINIAGEVRDKCVLLGSIMQMEKSMEWYRKAAEVGLELVMKARKKWASPDIEYLDN